MKYIHPYNKDNFQNSSSGIFKHIKFKNINFESWKLFYSSKNSKYFLNKNQNKLLRISDHWCNNIELIGQCVWFVNKPILLNEWECGIIRFKDLKEIKKNFKQTHEMKNLKKNSIKKLNDKKKMEENNRRKEKEILELKKKINKNEEQYEKFKKLNFDEWINLNEESENINILKDQLSQIKLELDEIN